MPGAAPFPNGQRVACLTEEQLVQAVRNASTVAVSTRPETACAKSGSEVAKTSAWSLVSATY